jgi:hypothetical protein
LAAPAAACLRAAGFEAVPNGLPPLVLLGLLTQAGWLAGASGRLMQHFCPAGVRVVELCDAAAFSGADWMVSVKLGLMHGVARCEPAMGGLSLDAEELNALLDVMALRS